MLEIFRTKIQQLGDFQLLLLIFIIFFASSVEAQGIKNQFSIGKTIFFESDFLEETRPIIIHTPQSYKSSKRSYPIMYLIDGDVHFNHASGLADFLSLSEMLPEMIVVAIPNIDRNRDLTPPSKSNGGSHRQAGAFLDFLEFELLPYIDRKYRVKPFRILYGHSLGGLFTLYTLHNRQQLFRAYFASSPYLMEHSAEIFQQTKELDGKLDDKNKFLYIAVGNEPLYLPTVTKFIDLLEIHAPDRLAWNYQYMQNENHGTVPPLAIFYGLRSLFSGWMINNEQYDQGFDAVNRHYEKLSDWFGFPIPIPESIVNTLGYESINDDDAESAIRIFRYNIERYPDSPNVYDSAADAYRASGDLTEAEQLYRTAVKKAKKISDPALPFFEDNLKSIKKLIRQSS